MLQRIQTIYLLFVFLIQLAGFIFLSDRLLYSGVSVELNQSYILLISNLLLIVVPFWNIFQFRNRKQQFVLNRVLLLITLGVLFNQCIGYFNADNNETHQLLVCVVAMLTIIFLSLANKAIKRDEDLVRSADRLR
ncbi:MAG: DUF4293 family protein [Flavobacteriaceae bacterium]|nr:DUF4293 family protein [Flavobacteriaceae bacterium]